jgi:hypothetical protein
MASSTFVAIGIVLGLMTISQAAHMCSEGVHYYVEHTNKCPRCIRKNDRRASFLRPSSLSFPGDECEDADLEAESERLGCNLFDFTAGTRFSRLKDQQVHWYGGMPDQQTFIYQQFRNNETCAPGGTTYTEFPMPDYCSRAIMSELSTVYNGVERTTSLMAALGPSAWGSTEPNECFTYAWQGKNRVYEKKLEKRHKSRACWNHIEDWKTLWCVKYNDCSCPPGMSAQECSQYEPKVGCCKAKYQEFLASKHNVYKGYPLTKLCRWNATSSTLVAPGSSLPEGVPAGRCPFNPNGAA